MTLVYSLEKTKFIRIFGGLSVFWPYSPDGTFYIWKRGIFACPSGKQLRGPCLKSSITSISAGGGIWGMKNSWVNADVSNASVALRSSRVQSATLRGICHAKWNLTQVEIFIKSTCDNRKYVCERKRLRRTFFINGIFSWWKTCFAHCVS